MLHAFVADGISGVSPGGSRNDLWDLRSKGVCVCVGGGALVEVRGRGRLFVSLRWECFQSGCFQLADYF